MSEAIDMPVQGTRPVLRAVGPGAAKPARPTLPIGCRIQLNLIEIRFDDAYIAAKAIQMLP